MAPTVPSPRTMAVVATVAVMGFLARASLFSADIDLDLDSSRPEPAAVRDLGAYEGLGTWIDAYDYGPAYADGDPPVTPDDIDAMADSGVHTLYVQANRDDERSPDGFIDRGLLDEFVRRAHERDMAVVGWYLPTFASVATDLGHLQDLLDYEVDGQRLDGIGVDIEYTDAVPDVARRNNKLLQLSRRLDRAAGETPISAIVLPPVLTEVVNPDFWPGFPWAELEPHYDIWLPMSYWTQRTESSGYNDGARYHEESQERLLANLGNPDAVVHGIGGIGDETSEADILAFAESLAASGAVGGSIYDWATLSDTNIALLNRLFAAWPEVE
jgi:hypothetical protein